MVKHRVVYAKSAVLLSPINKVFDLRKCVDCLQNYTRMYVWMLLEAVCFIQGTYIGSWILSSLYIMYS